MSQNVTVYTVCSPYTQTCVLLFWTPLSFWDFVLACIFSKITWWGSKVFVQVTITSCWEAPSHRRLSSEQHGSTLSHWDRLGAEADGGVEVTVSSNSVIRKRCCAWASSVSCRCWRLLMWCLRSVLDLWDVGVSQCCAVQRFISEVPMESFYGFNLRGRGALAASFIPHYL